MGKHSLIHTSVCFSQCTGSTLITFYCALFGLAFVLSSSVYLATLSKFSGQRTWTTSCTNWTEDNSTAHRFNSNTPHPCDNLRAWNLYAYTGLYYGLVFCFYGLCHLCYLLRAQFSGHKEKNLNAAGDNSKMFFIGKDKGQTHHRLNSLEQTSSEKGFYAGCCNCIEYTVKYVVMSVLWVTSIICPTYLAVSLGSSNAIHGEDGYFYWPALTLFVICLLSLIFGTVAACSLGCVRNEYWTTMTNPEMTGVTTERRNTLDVTDEDQLHQDFVSVY